MSAFLLCVDSYKSPGTAIWIEDFDCDLTPSRIVNSPVRSSPIYCVDDSPSSIPLSPGMSKVLICYTLDAFIAVGRVLSHSAHRELRRKLFTTHGIASLVLFYEQDSDKSSLLDVIGDVVMAWEVWHTSDGHITSTEESLPTFCSTSEFYLHTKKHRLQEQVHFAAVNASLKKLSSISSVFPTEHREMVASVAKLAQQRSLAILFLENIITEDEYRTGISSFLNDESIDEVDESVKDLKQDSINAQRRVASIHSLRDEIVQLNAILKYVYAQGFSSMPPLRQNPWENGNFSLFGIGGVYAALLAVYGQVRKAFHAVQPETIVQEVFGKQKGPPFLQAPSDEPYATWFEELKSVQQSLALATVANPRSGPFHLVYFSHRLGFRATKLSVTAAWQSIILGTFPSWSLTTLFHEYLHIHTKSLLSELYPVEDIEFERVYQIYSQRLSEGTERPILRDFIKVMFMEAAGQLVGLENGGGTGPAYERVVEKGKLHKGLKGYFHEIDELFVHLLDFQYFHRGDADLYVKSIWSSWLTLPFATERLPEYVFRTLAAISSNRGKDRMEAFDWSMNKLRTQIESLVPFDFVRNEMIEALLAFLRDESEVTRLRHRFFALLPILQVLARFLVFPKIAELLFVESEDEEQDGGEYVYPEEPRYYANRIQSAVGFLIAQLKHGFGDGVPVDAYASFTRKSLWLFQALASTLKHDQD